MSKCKTVTLRKRKIKNGTQYSLCLDYYPGYRDNVTMRVITREALGIYIFAKPANQQERDFNARMMKKAVILRNQRYEAIFNENNGFFDKTKMKGDFLAYFKGLADRKNIKWQHVYKHFQRFVNGKCTFEEVDVDLCRKFMEYLLDAPQSIHTNQKLHINSAAGYWSTFRAVLHTAYRDRKIKENPNGFLDRIECIPTIREHLSQEELIRLAETPCEEEVLKKAFLFACLTGLRKSDIRQLTWQQIQPYTNGRMFVTTRMQKTKEIVHNPISDEAYGLLGERGEGLIFEDFKDSRSEKDLYKMREQLVSTFVILPFWHECVKGDTLEGISRRYTGSGAYVGELCGNPLNRIENPDLIEVGQRIEIPLHVLLKRETYEIGNE